MKKFTDKFMLNKLLLEKWLINLQIFLAPLGILYLTTIIGVISADTGGFHLADLIPNPFAQGAIALWVLNTALDYLRKLKKS